MLPFIFNCFDVHQHSLIPQLKKTKVSLKLMSCDTANGKSYTKEQTTDTFNYIDKYSTE